jgi:glycosyltransferase involved in cell wall biosynthesis
MKLWKGKDVIKKQGMHYHKLSKAIPLYNNKKRTISQSIMFGISSFKLLKADFDIIDCCGFPYFSLFPAKIACIIKRKPLYSTWHEVWGKEYWKSYLGWKGIFGYWIEKLASKMPNKIITVSDDTKYKLINQLKVNPNKIVVIPNGIDIKEIEKIKASKEKSDVIFAGRLLSHKNVDTLIESISYLKKTDSNYKNIKCIIVGDGPELNNLKALTKSLNLQNNVIFKGFIQKHEDVLSLIKSSKVFVLPSTREGFGIVVIEANACGVPVITINHKNNASKDLIQEDKNGYISELNEFDIENKIEKALKKKNWNTKQYIQKYDWNNIVMIFKEVYK